MSRLPTLLYHNDSPPHPGLGDASPIPPPPHSPTLGPPPSRIPPTPIRGELPVRDPLDSQACSKGPPWICRARLRPTSRRAGRGTQRAMGVGWGVMGDAVAGFYFTNRRFRRWRYRLLDRVKSRVTARRALALPAVHPWAEAIAWCWNGVVRREDQTGLGRVEQLRAALLASGRSIRVQGQERTVASICAGESVSPERGLFLYCLTRALAPAAVLELGTCLAFPPPTSRPPSKRTEAEGWSPSTSSRKRRKSRQHT